ncbi:Far upstream element-binding protein 1 [Manis javanica]|nr:Far upstream element-binding protein 1 [Manis javanica]
MLLLGYALLRAQGWLPLNALGNAAQTPDLAFNTAASFVTNTNWQAYSGEQPVQRHADGGHHLHDVCGCYHGRGRGCGLHPRPGALQRIGPGQLLGGLCARAVARDAAAELCGGPGLCVAGRAAGAGWPGLGDDAGGRAPAILLGPVASLESIKHIGTNGGGFFGMNAAHPFGEPHAVTNAIHILGMLLIPSAMTYAFGSMLLRRRQGWVLFGACLVMFVGFLALVFTAEQAGNPLLTAAGADQQISATQPGGNMEGKELRFGIADTALFVATTTAATTGSVNAMHDSLTPLGGLVPLAQMMINCVFGGDGVGLINLLQYAILTVFLAGMMIGRTPEFLGKKIEAREIKLVMLAVMAHPISVLGFTALAAVWPTLASLANRGPHGFSEVLYAYSSATGNNGSAFAGLNANTPFFNTTIGLAMLAGRYLTLLPMLALAGSLAAKPTVPAGPGTFPTATPLFMGLLVFVVVVVGGLTFLPSLALGPVVEQLQMLSGQVYP